MSISKSGTVPFFEYHGIEPGAYYGLPYRQDQTLGPPILLPRSKSKKSFATRLANQIDKLTGGGTIRGGDKQSNNRSLIHEAFREPHLTPTKGNRRTFHNVVPGRHPAASSPSGRVFIAPPTIGSTPKNYYNPWESPLTGTAHYIHPSRCLDIEEYDNDCCNCDDQSQFGTQRVKNRPFASRCRSCNRERIGYSPHQLRRTQSDESVNQNNNNMTDMSNNPYDVMRRRRLQKQNGNSIYIDEHDLDYAEADYIYSSGGRRPLPPRDILIQRHLSRENYHKRQQEDHSGSRHYQSSPASQFSTKKYNSTLSRDKSTPKHEGSKVKSSYTHSNGGVTVNGGVSAGQVGKNSSIIYLSPAVEDHVTYSGRRQAINANVPNPSSPTTIKVSHSSSDESYTGQGFSTTIEVSGVKEMSQSSGESDPYSSVDDDNHSRCSSDSDTSDKDSTISVDNDFLINGVAADRLVVRTPKSQIELRQREAIEELEKAINLESEESEDAEEEEEAASVYDADCSQLNSPLKVRNFSLSDPKRHHLLSQESILEEEDDDLDEEIKPTLSLSKSLSLGALKQEGCKATRRDKKLGKSRLGKLLLDQSSPTLTKSDQLRQRRNKQLSTSKSGESLLQDLHLPTSKIPNQETFRQTRETQTPERNHVSTKNSYLFNDTTRLRQKSRPSLDESLRPQDNSSGTEKSQLGRRRISQSFKERMVSPTRPREPPPPPPPTTLGTGSLKKNKGEHKALRLFHSNPFFNSNSLKKLKPKNTVEKPPRMKRERSQSFTPNSFPKASILHKSTPHLPQSYSHHSLDRRSHAHVTYDPDGYDDGISSREAVNTISSRFDEEDKNALKRLMKSSNSSNTTKASSAKLHHLIKLQVSNNPHASSEHIYEEIPENLRQRPLPPVPSTDHSHGEAKEVSVVTSPVKSIFQGASKYDILHYLEDAKERGFTDAELDVEEDLSKTEESQTLIKTTALVDRNHSNRVSNISSSSNCSQKSSNASSGPVLVTGKEREWNSVDIERNDSGLGSESGVNPKRPVRIRALKDRELSKQNMPPTMSRNLENLCEDCDQTIGNFDLEQNSDIPYDPLTATVCYSCARRRCERKEIITEIIETEIKYGRDLRIIRDEFQKPMEVAGLLSNEQLSLIFLNVEELIESNRSFTDALKDAIEVALDEADEDLCSVSIGRLFLLSEPTMLRAFKSYCTRQASASSTLSSLEKEKELLRIFLRVSQMENAILRRMNLSSFLMVPVQRVTKYPLLLSRLLKVTPAHHEDRAALQESREKIEHHLEHMNQEARDNSSTKLWRRISMINVASYKKLDNLDILGNTTWGIRKMSLDVLNWTRENREEVNFVLESKLLFCPASNADSNWRRGWTMKMTPVSAILVTLGSQACLEPPQDDVNSNGLQFPKDTGARQAALLLIREKNGKFSLIRDPLFLDKCIICWEQDWEDCFEIQEFAAKEAFVFKAEDLTKTRKWFKYLQFYSLGLGNWRRRRNGLANIMINGMGRKD